MSDMGFGPAVEVRLAERADRGLLGLEDEILTTRDPQAVAERLAGVVPTSSGDPVELLLYKASIGLVVGVRTTTGDRLALKLFPPRRHDPRHLRAARRLQHRLTQDHRIPGPVPLAETRIEATGAVVWVDQWRDAPAPAAEGSDLARRAAGLAAFTLLCATVEPDPDLRRGHGRWQPDALYPPPPRPEVDFTENPQGADWLDELVTRAKHAAGTLTGPNVLTHFDWRPANIRYHDGTLACVFDWDALGLGREVLAVANAASSLDPEGLATFVAAYEQARRPLARRERREIAAVVAWKQAVWARFEHARQLSENARTYTPLIADRVDELLSLYP